MKPEDQVCCIKFSRKLRDLGVKQESIWYWYVNAWNASDVRLREGRHTAMWEQGVEQPSAFTVAELGGMLPDMVHSGKRIPGGIGKFEIRYLCYNTQDQGMTQFSFLNEADARAAMLVHLIEKGIVQP